MSDARQDRIDQQKKNMEIVKNAMQVRDEVAQGSALTHAVPMDFVSDEGVHYTGVVVFKRPGAMDIMKVGGLKSEFLRMGGARDLSLVDNTVKILAHVMATLSVVLDKRPPWLEDVTQVRDVSVLYEVFDAYDAWERSFRKPIQGDASADSEDSDREEALDTP